MHIVLLVLKIIGIALLILIGIIVLVLIGLVFIPFVYTLEAEYYEDFKAVARIRWLWFVLDVKGQYGDSKFLYYLKSFGFMISTNDENDPHYKDYEDSEGKENKKSKKKNSSVDKGKVIVPDEIEFEDASQKAREPEPKKSKPSEKAEKLEKTEKLENADKLEKGDKLENTGKPSVSILDKIDQTFSKWMEVVTTIPMKIHTKVDQILTRMLDFFANINENIEKLVKKRDYILSKYRLVRKFLTHETTKAAWKSLIKYLKALLKHLKPRKCKGLLHFGMEDPSTTGEILGGIGVLYPIFRKSIVIAPDFEQKIFEGDLFIKGYVQVLWIVCFAIKVLLNRKLMKTFMRARKIIGGIKNGK